MKNRFIMEKSYRWRREWPSLQLAFIRYEYSSGICNLAELLPFFMNEVQILDSDQTNLYILCLNPYFIFSKESDNGYQNKRLIHTNTPTHTLTHTRTHTDKHTHTNKHTYTHTHIYIYIYLCIFNTLFPALVGFKVFELLNSAIF